MQSTALTPMLPGFTNRVNEAFKKRSQQIANNVNQRMRKLGFGGRWGLAEARALMAKALGKPCPYCGQRIKVKTMSPDHPIPVSRGGEPYAIQIVCQLDNRRKGELTADEYMRFLQHVKTYAPEAQEYILRMMAAGGAYFRLVRAMRGQAAVRRQKTEHAARQMAIAAAGSMDAV